MGKSAKLHKRVLKKVKSSPISPSGPSGSSKEAPIKQVQAAKKRSNLKEKVAGSSNKAVSTRPGQTQGVLGGADYVSLMMGGRRKAQKEALKLPVGDS